MKRKMNKLMNSVWEMMLGLLFCFLFFSLYLWTLNLFMGSYRVAEWVNAPLWMPVGALVSAVAVGVILYRAESNPAYHEQDTKEILKKNLGRY